MIAYTKLIPEDKIMLWLWYDDDKIMLWLWCGDESWSWWYDDQKPTVPPAAAASTSVIPCPGTKPRISLILLKVHITSKHHLIVPHHHLNTLLERRRPPRILNHAPDFISLQKFLLTMEYPKTTWISYYSDDRMISIKGYLRFPFVIPPNFLTTMCETKIIQQILQFSKISSCHFGLYCQ